jgi:hypothetical protein
MWPHRIKESRRLVLPRSSCNSVLPPKSYMHSPYEADYAFSFSTEVRNAWIYASVALYAFCVWNKWRLLKMISCLHCIPVRSRHCRDMRSFTERTLHKCNAFRKGYSVRKVGSYALVAESKTWNNRRAWHLRRTLTFKSRDRWRLCLKSGRLTGPGREPATSRWTSILTAVTLESSAPLTQYVILGKFISFLQVQVLFCLATGP